MSKTLELSAAEILSNIGNWAEENVNTWVQWGEVQISDADTTDQLIILADWNEPDLAKIARMLEEKYEDNEVTVQYDDEWVACSECGKFCRTNPTHYGWLPNYVNVEYHGVVCRTCVEEDPDYVLDKDAGYVDATNKALLPWCQPLLEKNGWTCFEPEDGCARYESGWFPGQTDDPKQIAEYLAEHLPKHNHVFVITSTGQFDIHWTVYVKPMEE